MIVYLLEALLIGVLLLIAVTQVLVPALRGRALFPAFSRKDKLKEELADVRAEAEERDLEERIKKERQPTTGTKEN